MRYRSACRLGAQEERLRLRGRPGKEALNFQLTVLVIALILFPFVFVVIGIPLLILLALADVVLTILAAIKAHDGVAYRYPFAVRVIK